MNYTEWLTAYTTLTNKLKKKAPLTSGELDELIEIIEKVRSFMNRAEYEVLKRQ